MSSAVPTPNTPESAEPKKKKGGCLKWGAIGAAALIVLGIFTSMGDDKDKASEPASSASSSAAAEPAASESSAADTKTSEKAKEDDVPREYKNALRQAEMYLKSQPFSEAGLRDQLTSEYGGQFPEDAADYALANVNADWNAEALEAAKAYQATMAMSDDQLIDQLTSPYGSQFTMEQAQYAVANL